MEILISQNLVPRQIQEKVLTLEEAFLNITQENVTALAVGGEER